MNGNLFYLVGGVGMFLVGMEIMTNALREAAGSRLRRILTTFTTTPLRGVLTGATTTAVVQSSSATTVMTVGFVGAGLLTMPEAMGVIYGANIGTTATGWLVSVLGFKLKLGNVALALLFPAALVDLLAHGPVARFGRVLSGLCLLLVGLELMQTGMGDLTETVTPAMLPGATFLGLLTLVGAGAAITILMQSSSAAMALSLVMLSAGAISMIQAASLVIGMNIGTTFTALLASLGGSVPMRQTAIANLIFNIATSVIAFPLLFLFRTNLEHIAASTDEMTSLLVFHTGFNLAGTALFLPITRQFSGLVARILPDKRERLIDLDERLLSDPGTAILAAQTAVSSIAARLFTAIGSALQPEPDLRPLAALGVCADALEELRKYLAAIRLTEGRAAEEEAFAALLHQIDHLDRLLRRAGQRGRMETLLSDRLLRRPGLAAGVALSLAAGDLASPTVAVRLLRLQALVQRRAKRHRRAMMLGEHAGLYSLEEVFAHTDAMRWLDRILHHAERVAHYQPHSPVAEPAAETSAAGQ